MAFGIGDSLNVKVKADSGDFTSSMDRAESSLNSLRNAAGTVASSLQILQGRTEEAGDELSSTRRDAARTSRTFTRLSISTSGLSVSFGVLGTVATASLIPALALLATTLAPIAVVIGGIVAATGSLVAVFGGLIGVGAITHMEELKQAFGEAKQEILEIIEPLGEVFGPLLVDAVQALPDLVRNIIRSLGPLDQFRRTLVNFGRFAMRVIPQITGFMFELAQAALPVLNKAFTTLTQNTGQANKIISGLSDIFFRTLPLLIKLGQALINVAGPVTRLGTTVATVVFPAFASFINLLSQGIQGFNKLVRVLSGKANQTLSEFATGVLETITSSLSDVASGAEGLGDAIVSGLTSMIEAAKNWLSKEENQALIGNAFSTIVTIVSNLLADVGEILGVFIKNVTEWFGKEKNKQALGNAFDTIVGILGDVFDEAIGGLVTLLQKEETQKTITSAFNDGFAVLTDVLIDAVGAFIDYLMSDDFRSDLGTAADVIGKTFASIINGIIPNRIKFTVPEVKAFGQTVGGETININLPNNPANLEGVQSGGFIESGGLARLHEGEQVVPAAQVTDRGEVNAMPNQIEITGTLTTDNGEVVAMIDDRVRMNERQQNGKVARKTGRPSRPVQ